MGCEFLNISRFISGALIALTVYSWIVVIQNLRNDKSHVRTLYQKRMIPVGGLGNLMFSWAGLHYFAEKLNATILLPSNTLLRRAFGSLRRTKFVKANVLEAYLLYIDDHSRSGRIYEFKACCDFVPDLGLFKERTAEIVRGYFQTYPYFHPKLKTEIQQSFTFLPGIVEMSVEELKTAARRRNQANSIFVGIHIRHGMDITWHSKNRHIKVQYYFENVRYHGHTTATAEYFEKAINHFRLLFSLTPPIFVVVADDIPWARRVLSNISKTDDEIYFSDSKYREVDMATLTLCNHTIMSTGTFSWWAAYLTNGKTVKYDGWPKKGTTLDIMVSRAKYFPPEWISL